MTPSSTPFDFVGGDHFREMPSRDAAIDLFRRSVIMVEIETFSYCNRRCWFCPNSFIDRHSTTEYMPEALYSSILDQLGEARYGGTISFSRYNEPLADPVIVDRITQARRVVPDALLHTNTNGDYLTPAYLATLSDAGLRSLNIQIYLANDERYHHARMRAKLDAVTAKLGLDMALVRDDADVWIEAAGRHLEMTVRVYARNFDVNGCNRGESVPIPMATRRTSPCLSPFYHLYIDYTGHVVPCCNFRSDNPAHRGAIVANLQDTPDLFRVYGGERLAGWRRDLVGFTAKSGHCGSCRFGTIEATPQQQALQSRLVTMAGTNAARRGASA